MKSKPIKPFLKFIPEEILSQSFPCNNCGKIFLLDWLKPVRFPVVPVEVKGGRWVPMTTNVECPNCRKITIINLPRLKSKGSIYLFGDEAFRSLTDNNNAMLYTYSLIGASKGPMEKVNDQIVALKSKLIPKLAPNSWSIHMKDIWSGNGRNKNPNLSSWTIDSTSTLLEGVKQIFCREDNYLFKYNILFVGKQNIFGSKINLEQFIRNEVYTTLIAFVINNITKIPAQPIICFDSQKNSKSDKIIHQWAHDAFNSTQSTLLYPFISRGIPIKEPVFVPPAKYPLLEMADVMSFLIARYHQSKILNKTQDVNLNIIGETLYLTVDNKSQDLIFQRSSSYPWEIKCN